MHPKKIESVLGLPPPERYDYMIRKVADFDAAYGLYDDGWAMMADDTGQQCFPIWPESEFSELLATGDWARFVTKRISLEQLVNAWIPGLTRDQISVAAFPTPGEQGVIVSADQLGNDLAEEASQYE